MRRYDAVCGDCGPVEVVHGRVGDPPPGNEVPCPKCGAVARRNPVLGCAYAVHGDTKGNHGNIHVEHRYASPNYSYGKMTAAQREQADKKYFKVKKEAARKTQMARRGTKRSNDEIRLAGNIPFGLYTAMRNKHGHDYWTENPKKKLKRHGLAFDG